MEERKDPRLETLIEPVINDHGLGERGADGHAYYLRAVVWLKDLPAPDPKTGMSTFIVGVAEGREADLRRYLKRAGFPVPPVAFFDLARAQAAAADDHARAAYGVEVEPLAGPAPRHPRLTKRAQAYTVYRTRYGTALEPAEPVRCWLSLNNGVVVRRLAGARAAEAVTDPRRFEDAVLLPGWDGPGYARGLTAEELADPAALSATRRR